MHLMREDQQALSVRNSSVVQYLIFLFLYNVNQKLDIAKNPSNKARFKRRILHAPNRISKLSACQMRHLNQLNATYFNSIRVSRIFD